MTRGAGGSKGSGVTAVASRVERAALAFATSYSSTCSLPWRSMLPSRSSRAATSESARRVAPWWFRPPSGSPPALSPAC
eukprot:scaffold48605_cov75-Phaeocystis_antarctica.AAC.2